MGILAVLLFGSKFVHVNSVKACGTADCLIPTDTEFCKFKWTGSKYELFEGGEKDDSAFTKVSKGCYHENGASAPGECDDDGNCWVAALGSGTTSSGGAIPNCNRLLGKFKTKATTQATTQATTKVVDPNKSKSNSGSKILSTINILLVIIPLLI